MSSGGWARTSVPLIRLCLNRRWGTRTRTRMNEIVSRTKAGRVASYTIPHCFTAVTTRKRLSLRVAIRAEEPQVFPSTHPGPRAAPRCRTGPSALQERSRNRARRQVGQGQGPPVVRTSRERYPWLSRTIVTASRSQRRVHPACLRPDSNRHCPPPQDGASYPLGYEDIVAASSLAAPGAPPAPRSFSLPDVSTLRDPDVSARRLVSG